MRKLKTEVGRKLQADRQLERQALKNEALGEDVCAIEVYPMQAHVVNEQNYRHLWEVPEELDRKDLPVRTRRSWKLQDRLWRILGRQSAEPKKLLTYTEQIEASKNRMLRLREGSPAYAAERRHIQILRERIARADDGR